MLVVGSATGIDVQLRSILVATDFTPVSEKALRHAIAISRYYRSKLYFVHVVSSMGLNLAGPEAIAKATELAWRDARQVERKLQADRLLEGLNHEIVVTSGEIWKETLEIIRREQIDMVVIGTQSRTGISKLMLGSVAEEIFRHAPCPVLTVGPYAPREDSALPPASRHPLLFPTDFGERSLAALPYALSFAKQRGTGIVLFHALSPVPETDNNRWYTASDITTIRATQHASAIERLRGLIPSSLPELEPICVAEFGDPAESIVRIADELRTEAIIMGLNHTTNVKTMAHLPWSTTYRIVCEARCPVLTVRS